MAKNVSSKDLIDLYEGKNYIGRYHEVAGERITRVFKFLRFSRKDKVLDIGCGNGLLLPEIYKKIGHYDGVDFSKAFIEDAKKRAERRKIPKSKYSYYQDSIVKFCTSHKNYDKIFALDFIEHVNDRELNKIFIAVKDSMKKGGRLIVHTPNSNYLLERLKPRKFKIERQGHIGLRNTSEYKRIFKLIGFSKVEIIPVNHYVKVLKPLHIFSHIPQRHLSEVFQARLIIICEK